MRGFVGGSRRGTRLARRVGVVTLFTVLLSVGLPASYAARCDPVHVSWSGLWSWLTAPRGWALPPTPPTPRQPSGSAAGRGHEVPAAATRAGGGAGHPRGESSGELAGYAPYGRKFTVGQSAPSVRGFDAKTSVRVAAKSTATSTYFSNADGTYTRKFAPGPVNYRDASGNWQPIDTTVRLSGDGRWRERANSTSLSLAPFADGSSLVSFAADPGHVVTLGLSGATHVPGHGSGSTVTYLGALTGTDLRVTATPTGQQQQLVLRGAVAATSWVFDLGLRGLSAVTTAAGLVDLVDATGHTKVEFKPGYASDSNVNPKSGDPAFTNAVSVALSTVAGRTALRVSLDSGWLTDPARVFPVVVQPLVVNGQANSSAITTYVESGDGMAGDHSLEPVIKVGSYDSGTHSARSFLMFPNLGIDNSGASVIGASLDLGVLWASTCAPQEFDVAPVTSPWTPSTLTTYPGPSLGASIGSLTEPLTRACTNTSRDPSLFDDAFLTLSVAPFNAWAAGTSPDYGLAVYAPTTDSLHWKEFGSPYSPGGAGPGLALLYSGTLLPQVLAQTPANGTAVPTLTPQLSADGSIDPNSVRSPQYDYQVVDANGALVVDSGLVGGAYTVPAGKLRWGQTYYWMVQASDGVNFSPNPVWYQLTVQVPQPAVTSSLSQNAGGHGFEPSIGNYTTSVTDAEAATVGPALSVVRDYNSRDPRTSGAFGAAWSSVFDARAAELYDPSGAVSTVVVTYPDGAEVGYGRNADGGFTAPLGRAAKLIRLLSGYELVDKDGTTYTFAQSLAAGVYGIASITDVNARSETFTWSSGHITTVASAVSGRALHLTWSTPTGAGSAHVASVSTDPVVAGQPGTALTWTYNYTADQLTSQCPPGTTTACTSYGYDPHAAAQTRNQVMDMGPASYWPLAETTGTVASSQVLANVGADNGTYSGVSLGQIPGPLAGSSAAVAGFNGTTSSVALPDLHMATSLAQSVSLWFKTSTPGGVLFSYSDVPIAPTASRGLNVPALYVGSDGKLMGTFWLSQANGPTPIASSGSVADGRWHHVVLTGSQTQQSLYLDGGLVGSIGGWSTFGFQGQLDMQPGQWRFAYLGTGYVGGWWPDAPHAGQVGSWSDYFTGRSPMRRSSPVRWVRPRRAACTARVKGRVPC